MNNLITVFLTGLITGGLTCMAVQGGLLITSLAQSEEDKLQQNKKGNAIVLVSFLVSKLIAYTLLGFLLGWVGSLFQITIQTRAILLLVVSLFMIGAALNMLNVHPIFRYFILQPPRFLTRLIRKQSKNDNLFNPIILGASTVFIPCGTTQAIMALAIASGNPLMGATIMFAFILGTSPVFFALGYFAMKLGDIFKQKFLKLAALAIIILAILNINNSIALMGSNLTIGNLARNFWCTVEFCTIPTSGNGSVEINNNPTITIQSFGYTPNVINVKAGAEVKIRLVNTNGTSCAQAFTIPSLGIQKIVSPGSSDEISFTAPNYKTQIQFMCSMGMYRGVINVI